MAACSSMRVCGRRFTQIDFAMSPTNKSMLFRLAAGVETDQNHIVPSFVRAKLTLPSSQ